MPKELIVSVIGREKKIAIVENGRTTEFYIERGEGSQGIVGNIYKGRVMRVLPGMQSAFVDIGLDRDAFLYVSDFFDEEEEFERIVVDKTKSEGADAEAAARAAAERIERSRIERERQIESAHENAEPEGEPMSAPPVIESPVTASPVDQSALVDEEEADGRRGRDRRKRRRDREVPSEPPEATVTYQAEEVRTPFVDGTEDFQRIVDEEENAAEDGSMFKDARVQERLLDQIHAVEFDMEANPSSVFAAGSSSSPSFERVDDDSDASQTVSNARRSAQPKVAASIARLEDELVEEDAFVSNSQSFQRISDDEAVEAVVGSPDKTVAEAKAKRGAGRSATKRGAKASSTEEVTEEASNKKRRTASPGKTSKRSATKTASKKTASKGKTRAAKASSDEVATEEAGGDSASLEDSEARVTTRSSRGEFARRGGRRRRRPGQKPPGENDEGQETPNGDAEVVVEVEEPRAEIEVAPSSAAGPVRSRGRGRDGRGERPERGDRSGGQRETREPAQVRDARNGREPREGRESRDSRNGRDSRSRRERQPTITDLLREGQEIIVQIAKEPISQKGARITSHIALPGRFLVYMPTIEHVGVSRKIESDTERVRLRKLIQNIVKTEDLPSGGFIVRTAGVGISEQDLRDDARYLVRTWRDIRRNAEKQKAPALVHKDLDLVQRILRDQLSDDFTAIRIDSEEEYRDVVEFVNRIQPRLVNRVKLYTREEPILEAYGVQSEIDKAIKPRVWLKSGGYLVINQTEALVAIDVNTGKFVGRGGSRLEDTITRTNMEAVEEIARQIRLRDLGGIIVLDLIDMEERRNRARVLQALQEALRYDKSPTKVLSYNDFGLIIMTRKRVKQSLERTLCSPCPYCQGAGLVKSPQTICYEILEDARRLARSNGNERMKQTTLRVHPEVARALRSTERDVLNEIEDYLGSIDIDSDDHVHQEQFDFAFI
jgi:ribonuclease G